MYNPQPISDRPVGLGFLHRAGRFRPGESAFSSPDCRSCKGIEGFLIRKRKPILPGVCWLYVRSPANQRQAIGVGVSTPCEVVSTRGITVFVPGCRSCKCMEGLMIRGWEPVVPGWRWLYSRAPANQRSTGGVGVSTPCGAVSTRGITVFVPGLSELQMYGGISEPRMGTYLPRVRRDRGVPVMVRPWKAGNYLRNR